MVHSREKRGWEQCPQADRDTKNMDGGVEELQSSTQWGKIQEWEQGQVNIQVGAPGVNVVQSQMASVFCSKQATKSSADDDDLGTGERAGGKWQFGDIRERSRREESY